MWKPNVKPNPNIREKNSLSLMFIATRLKTTEEKMSISKKALPQHTPEKNFETKTNISQKNLDSCSILLGHTSPPKKCIGLVEHEYFRKYNWSLVWLTFQRRSNSALYLGLQQQLSDSEMRMQALERTASDHHQLKETIRLLGYWSHINHYSTWNSDLYLQLFFTEKLLCMVF